MRGQTNSMIIEAHVSHFWNPYTETKAITRWNSRLSALKPGDKLRLSPYTKVTEGETYTLVDLIFGTGARISVNIEDDKKDALLAEAGDGGVLDVTIESTSISESPELIAGMTCRTFNFGMTVHI